MAEVLITPPDTDPVLVQELLEHLRITSNDEHEVIRQLLKAATSDAENYLQRALITQTWKHTAHRFPVEDFIKLPWPPLQAITHVKYYDEDNQLQTFDSAKYELQTSTSPGLIRLVDGESWPSTYNRAEAVEITYVAGYGDAPDDVPAGIKLGIKMQVAHYFVNRQPVVVGVGSFPAAVQVPETTQALYNQYRVCWP